MSKTRKIKILSDGERFGSDIVDAETGETLRNVMKASIIIEGPEPPHAILELLAPAMDITATAEEVQVGWVAALYLQVKEQRSLLVRLAELYELEVYPANRGRVLLGEIHALLEKYPDEDAEPPKESSEC